MMPEPPEDPTASQGESPSGPEDRPADLPAGWRLVADRSGQRRDVMLINLTSLAAALPFGALMVVAGLAPVPVGPLRPPTDSTMLLLSLTLLALLLASVLHEWVHGLTMQAVGGRPRYGAKLIQGICPVFYAHCDEPLRRDQYLLVTVAPTVAVTAVGVLLMLLLPRWGFFALAAAAGNLAGCTGDWWIAARLLRERPDVFVQDHPREVGYRLVAPDPGTA